MSVKRGCLRRIRKVDTRVSRHDFRFRGVNVSPRRNLDPTLIPRIFCRTRKISEEFQTRILIGIMLINAHIWNLHKTST